MTHAARVDHRVLPRLIDIHVSDTTPGAGRRLVSPPLPGAAPDPRPSRPPAGIPSGPLVIQLAAGARDQTGHAMSTAFTLNTGLYDHDREKTTALRYPALIQIPNDSFARDQNGLQAASLVFEYVAEGGITRLTAIFHNAPRVVGPMR